jgi:beta-D-xylosidase 4
VNSIATAVKIAKDADAVVVVVGLDGSQEGEGHDKTSLLLPGNQTELIEAVAAVSSDPIVVVLMSGSALDVSEIVNNHKVGAVLWVGYPGQSGGVAIAEAVVGVTAVSGRLPMTWYILSLSTPVEKH